jgi:hypothetical protein
VRCWSCRSPRPRAFGRDAITFAAAYFVLRWLHVVLSSSASRADRAPQGATTHLLPNAAAATALLLAAAFLGGTASVGCWVAVIVISYAGSPLGSGEQWRISPSHFVERVRPDHPRRPRRIDCLYRHRRPAADLDAAMLAAALLGLTAVACSW